MNITLQNYTSEIPKQLQKKAEKNIVRECDENPKGVFTAYVDDGDDTFDVCLSLSSKNEITKDSCDCKSKIDFCIHKVALVIFIAKGKKINYAVKTKKISKTETLLQNADPEKLKDWVREILAKNKDIELTFTHYFIPKEISYTVDEVSKITTETAKAIIKNKKNVDPTLLKKLVDVWNEVQSPFLQHYLDNIADENAFSIFKRMIELGESYQFSLYINSNKITKYIDSLFQKTIEPINLLQNEEQWLKAVNLFVHDIVDHGLHTKVKYLAHLINIMSVSSEERKQLLAQNICSVYEKCNPEKVINFHTFTEKLFAMLEENDLLDTYYTIFHPIRFNNDFNIKLIKKLIEKKEFNQAIDYCKKQINANYNEEYSVPYYQLLREIYTETKNDVGLVATITFLFPYTYEFDDFLFIYENITDATEKKNWRTKILSKAKNASNKTQGRSINFIFNLMNYEKKYKKMIEYIDIETNFTNVFLYFEPMFEVDKIQLLKNIIDKSDGWNMYDRNEENKHIYPALMQKLIASYGENIIRSHFINPSKSSFYFANSFVRFVNEKL